MTQDSNTTNEEAAVVILKGRLKGAQRFRLARLLNMMYRPSELAEELAVDVRQVYRVYVPAGCPHKRDRRRHIWINGVAFRQWYVEVYKRRRMAKDEAFCLTCRKPVKMANKEKHEKDGLSFWLCDCPHCGRRLARIVNMRRQ
jgi:hypothetical protein